ncbi:MAG: subclass B1 metallo-beta-lactamase [Thermodesulfobacteriota bacterium]
MVTIGGWSVLLLFLASTAAAQERLKVHLAPDVFVETLEEGVWRHVSYKHLPALGPFPSNGLIVQFGAEIVLVDSAWDDEQTKLILDWVQRELHALPSVAIFTHAHEDRLGGIHEVHARGIRTISSRLTAELTKQQGIEAPQQIFDGRMELSLSGRTIRVQYPGPGHTTDNIVVWIPDKKILFGGCLVRAAQATGLGNTKEADLKRWPETIKRVYQEFREARIVVPGHGDPGGIEALTHTLELLGKAGGT